MVKQIRFPYTSKRTRHRSVLTVLGRCMCHTHFAPIAEGYITQFLFKLANQRLPKAHAFVDIRIVVALNLVQVKCRSVPLTYLSSYVFSGVPVVLNTILSLYSYFTIIVTQYITCHFWISSFDNQINTGGSENQNKYILLWCLWSLTAISDARYDLHRRQFSMLITAVAFTGTARMRDHCLYARTTSSDH